MIRNILQWLHLASYYVIADPADNSVTLSKSLFKRLNVMKLDAANVFVFFIPEEGSYGFMLNPSQLKDTEAPPLCAIHYNYKYRCVGFETLCPTVNYIFYRYKLGIDKPCKLSVKECKMKDGTVYYKICRPI